MQLLSQLVALLATSAVLGRCLAQTERHATRLLHSHSAASARAARDSDQAEAVNARQRRGAAGVHQELFPEFQVEDGYESPLSAAASKLEDSIADDVTEDGLMDALKEVTGLEQGGDATRSYMNADAIEGAAAWIKGQFESMGFSRVCLQHFDVDGHPETNVVALIDADAPGSVTVGAHYDSRPFSGPAPGANDNGSGTAAMLELARIFRKDLGHAAPKKPLYFVAFAAEEHNLDGSKHFTAALADPKDDSLPSECRTSHASDSPPDASPEELHQAVIMDEIGWRSPSLKGDTVNLETYDTEGIEKILNHLAQSNLDHNKHPLTVVHSNNPFGSDHMSWLDRGMGAVLTINGDDEAYPAYHSSDDKISEVSGSLLEKVAKMNAGAILRMTGLDTADSQ